MSEELSKEELTEMGLEEVKRLFRIAHRVNTHFIGEMLVYKEKIDGSKTKPKKDLYTKKFRKVQKEFFQNTAKLEALMKILQENNIEPDEVLEKKENVE